MIPNNVGSETHSATHPKNSLLLYAILFGSAIGLLVFASYLRPRPVEETVTVEANQPQPRPLVSVVKQTFLSQTDPDIETAGDHVAGAYIYLKRRQSQPALNALQQAESAVTLAAEKKPNGSKIRNELLSINEEIEKVQELIQKSKTTLAAKELRRIDQTLDSLSHR